MNCKALRIMGFGAALVMLSACGKKDGSQVVKQAPTTTQQAATPAAQPVPFDPSKYLVTATENITLNEQAWNKTRQASMDIVEHSNATTPEILATLKFPDYAKITNPFDKEKFKKEHQADLNPSRSEQKIKLVVRQMVNATLEPGDPLHGVYKGSLDMSSGSMFGYSLGSESIKYVLKDSVPNGQFVLFKKTVSEDEARRIEPGLTRGSNGVATSVPVIVYGTVIGTGVNYQMNNAQNIVLTVRPDAIYLANEVSPDAKPLLQVFPEASNSQ